MNTMPALLRISIIVLMFPAWAGNAFAQLDSTWFVPKKEPVQRARPFIRDSAEFVEKHGEEARGDEEARWSTGTDGNDWMRTNRNDAYYEEQARQHLFDRKVWEEQKKDKNYRNERPPEKPEVPEGTYRISVPQGGPFLQVLVFGIVIIGLAFLLYKLLGGTFVKNKKVSNKVFTIEDIEDRIHESDLDRLLREALERKDYRLAIRIYYLAIIKELSLKELIRWKRDKTNREYLNEVIAAKPELHGGFRETTIAFERAWYGDIEVGEQDYNSLSPRFRQFMEAISR